MLKILDICMFQGLVKLEELIKKLYKYFKDVRNYECVLDYLAALAFHMLPIAHSITYWGWGWMMDGQYFKF